MITHSHLSSLLPWRKSSYSQGDNNNCVEVARLPLDWRKSRHSAANDNCVEIARVPANWRKARRSSAEGAGCVEVGTLADGTAIRDSKNPGGPIVAVSRAAWRNFTGGLKVGQLGD